MRVPGPAGPLLVALLMPFLTGCGSGPAGLADYDHHVAHPLGAEVRTALLTLEIPPRPDAPLDAREAARLSAFAQDFVNKGEGIMELVVAAGPAGAASGGRFADTVIRALVAGGVEPGRISARLVADEAIAARGSAMLRYRQWAAVVPECGHWDRDVQVDHRGANTPNFGCATQRNIGLMVANPRDLVRPAPRDGRLGTVGDRVITTFGAGRNTPTQVIVPESTTE